MSDSMEAAYLKWLTDFDLSWNLSDEEMGIARAAYSKGWWDGKNHTLDFVLGKDKSDD